MVGTDYEARRKILPDLEKIKKQISTESPLIYSPVHLISRIFGDYCSERVLGKHIHLVYDMSMHPQKFYHEVSIPKRSGGIRILNVPNDDLKSVQSFLSRRVLNWYYPPQNVTAYAPGCSTRKNALPHVGAKYLIKLDISDFFGSITFAMVKKCCLPDADNRYGQSILCLIAGLCTTYSADKKDDKGNSVRVLRQGAPTSPVLSNIVMAEFDEKMIRYCAKAHIEYTRYCDDMSFSSAQPIDVVELLRSVRFSLPVGMRLNEKKTSVQNGAGRMQVTGITVNERAQVGKEYKRELRQQLYYIERYGVDRHLWAMKYDGKISYETTTESYFRSLLGKISYACYINPDDSELASYRNKVLGYLATLSALGNI